MAVRIQSNKLKLSFFIAFFMSCISSSTFAALPKIGAHSGNTYGSFYYVDTGKPFYPEGNVFQKIDANSVQYQFNEGVYDAALAENSLAWMEAWGYNVVRVWIDNTSRGTNYSIAGPANRNQIELYPPYMANLTDFLRRARNHNVYVVIANLFFPSNTYYNNIFYSGMLPSVTGWNTYFYTPGGRNAMNTFMKELATEIAAADNGDLKTTVLSFEIWNELFSTTAEKPFSLSSGTVATVDGSFDMSNAASRQSCHDYGLGQFVIQASQAVRQAIPDALTSASVFTNNSVQHTGFNGLLPINTADQRWPARIYWFASIPDISYLDIHFYPSGTSWSLSDELNSMEWSSIDKSRKPLFAGELGASKSVWQSSVSAAAMLGNTRSSLYNAGFQGTSHYTYDSTGDPNYWSIWDNNGAVNNILAPINRWKNYEFNGSTTEGWTTTNMSSLSVNAGKFNATYTANPASITSPAALNINTKFVRKVAVSLKNGSNANGVDLYWITSTDTTWNEAKSIHLSQTPNSNQFNQSVFNLWNNPLWTGTVTQLMIVPGRLWGGGTLSGTTAIDYIHAMDWVDAN